MPPRVNHFAKLVKVLQVAHPRQIQPPPEQPLVVRPDHVVPRPLRVRNDERRTIRQPQSVERGAVWVKKLAVRAREKPPKQQHRLLRVPIVVQNVV